MLGYLLWHRWPGRHLHTDAAVWSSPTAAPTLGCVEVHCQRTRQACKCLAQKHTSSAVTVTMNRPWGFATRLAMVKVEVAVRAASAFQSSAVAASDGLEDSQNSTRLTCYCGHLTGVQPQHEVSV